jgi:hypothetical protein
MRIVTTLLAGVLAFSSTTAGAQNSVIAKPGDVARVTVASSRDSVVQGRLSWISSDSVAVWRRPASVSLPISNLRAIQVRRRPAGYAQRTIGVAIAAGVLGGVLGARLGACRRSGAPPGGIDFSCDTPDPSAKVFAVIGSITGAGTGWLVQAIREPKRWVGARIVPQ